MTAKYIWYPGEYEIYHSLKLHSRRADNGIYYPPVWKMPYLYSVCLFEKSFSTPADSSFKVVTDSMANITLDGKRYPAGEDIALAAGDHYLRIQLYNKESLCTLFIDSPYLVTDESWTVTDGNANQIPAACVPAFTNPDTPPTQFPFSYSPLTPVGEERICDCAVLYDYGKETFGPTFLENCDPEATIRVFLGESREEALSGDDCYAIETLNGQTSYAMPTHAFRFAYIRSDRPLGDTVFSAQYEYLPLEDVGNFSCDDPQIEKIWQLCAYTYHLCSRECLLDGIKRDRWVWAGDVYQSQQINNYLFLDPDIIRRSIIALLGKPPYVQHINTINDYTLYLIISCRDYYYLTGDLAFLKTYWSRIKALWEFMVGRLDENGFVTERPGDWIFIDWCDMDREGPNATEQILLWKTCAVMAELAALVGEDGGDYPTRAEALKENIFRYFWDEEKAAFIDSYTTGNRRVSRHPHIFAILFGLVDEKMSLDLAERILLCDQATPITTPYFKAFELEALCKTGHLDVAQEVISSYWGEMLKLGATSVWEQFDPKKSGAEHYEMYGFPFGCSLCHVWGTGPICFLGKFCLGVRPTSVGYKTFAVEPKAGIYKSFRGTVPLPNGRVEVSYENGVLTVSTDCEGGTVRVSGNEYPLTKEKLFTLECSL